MDIQQILLKIIIYMLHSPNEELPIPRNRQCHCLFCGMSKNMLEIVHSSEWGYQTMSHSPVWGNHFK